jgi:hypothetical protein
MKNVRKDLRALKARVDKLGDRAALAACEEVMSALD